MRMLEHGEYEHTTFDPAYPWGAPLGRGVPERTPVSLWVKAGLRLVRRLFCRHRFYPVRLQMQSYLLTHRFMADCECTRCGAWYYAARQVGEGEMLRAQSADVARDAFKDAVRVEVAAQCEKASSGWWRFL